MRTLRVRLVAATVATLALLAGCTVRPAAPKPEEAPAGQMTPQPAPVEAPAGLPAPGRPAPDFTVKDVITGESVKLSSLKGQVVLLNFWATWCAPCRIEMPELQTFHEANKDRVRIVALGADGKEGPADLAGYAKDLGLTFTVGYDGGAAAVDTYKVIGIPTTFFIDQKGIVRAKFQGAMTLQKIKQYAAEAESLGKQ